MKNNKENIENSIESKNVGGRPLKYTLEELQSKINEYFDKQVTKGDDGKFRQAPYTISGLCVYLDINMDTFYEWEENLDKGFSETIKKARLRILEFAESRLYSKSPVGAIFQ